MKKFQFRLQTILKLRRQQEDQKKRDVGLLVSQINEYQRQALEMAQIIKEQGYILKEHIQGDVDVSWIAGYQGYINYLRQSIAEKINSVTQVQPQLNQARRALAEAAKQTKILEKLEEKLRNRHEERLKKMEAREIDEIGNNAFLRSRRLA